MHRHVYGPVYGCLEHRVPNVQLQITEGKSSHVNVPSSPFVLSGCCLDSGGAQPTSGVHNLCRVALRQQHAINCCYNTSRTGKKSLWTLAITSLWTFVNSPVKKCVFMLHIMKFPTNQVTTLRNMQQCGHTFKSHSPSE